MSETLFKFLLSELRYVRIKCKNKNCRSQAVIEIPINRLDRLYERWECPLCKEPFRTSASREECNYLEMLARAIEGLQQENGALEVEFIVPGDGTGKERP